MYPKAPPVVVHHVAAAVVVMRQKDIKKNPAMTRKITSTEKYKPKMPKIHIT